MKLTHGSIAALAAVSFTLGLACATPADEEPTHAWNQAKVVALAGELVGHVENAYTAANTETVDVDQMEPISSYLVNLRTLQRQCRHLESELQAGKSRQETDWIYDEIKDSHRQIQDSPSWRMIEGGLQGSASSVTAVLQQLDGYYGED